MNDSTIPPDPTETELLEALGGKAFACPPIEVLLALEEDALPEDVAAAARAHVANCRLCAMLIADMAELPEAEFTGQQRVLARMPRERWRSAGALAIAAALLIAGFLGYRSRPEAVTRAVLVAPAVSGPKPIGALPFVPLAAPAGDVGLLTRGAGQAGTPSVQELLPAFRAYNQQDYVLAAKRFSAVVRTYPESQLAALYLGVSELGAQQNAEAAETLRRARGMSHPYDADAVIWFSAVAEARLQRADARGLLEELCAESGSRYSVQSCGALR